MNCFGLGLGLGLGSSGSAAWTPASLGKATLVGWYDSAHVSLDGSNNVQTATDMSGNANDATQAAPASRPGYAANGGANNAAYFVGGTSLSLQTSSPVLAQPLEHFFVGRAPGVAPGASTNLVDLGGSNAAVQAGGTMQVYQYAGLFGAHVTLTASADFIVDCIFDGASSSIALSGGAPVTGNAGAGAGTGITLGNANGGGAGYTGNYYEVIVCNSVLSSGDRAKVIQYLKKKYAIA